MLINYFKKILISHLWKIKKYVKTLIFFYFPIKTSLKNIFKASVNFSFLDTLFKIRLFPLSPLICCVFWYMLTIIKTISEILDPFLLNNEWKRWGCQGLIAVQCGYFMLHAVLLGLGVVMCLSGLMNTPCPLLCSSKVYNKNLYNN